MIPVDQTILYDPDPASLMGNCFQACVASIFELPLDMVPHFCQEEDWYLLFTNWLEENYGLHPLLIDEGISQSWGICYGEGFSIQSGLSDRGVLHSVVANDMKIVHDPHPSKSGIKKVKDSIFFLALDPCKSAKEEK